MANTRKNETAATDESAAIEKGVNVASVKLIYRSDTNTKAVMSVAFDGKYALHGVKVVAGPRGDFVSLPSYKDAGGQYHDHFHPITAEAMEELYGAVMDAYNSELAQKQCDGQEAGQEERGGEEHGQEESGGAAGEAEEEGPSMAM